MPPGPILALGIMLALIGAIVILPGVIAQIMQTIDPINSLIKSESQGCPGYCPFALIPEIFAVGEPRDTVQQRLKSAGFMRDADSYIHRRADHALFVCEYDYHVEVSYDEAGLLTEATGHVTGMCM